jgi:hypothetical protein
MESTNYEIKCLLSYMKKIYKDYKKNDLYPYEIFTLMCNYAISKNYNYDMQIHLQLMDKI